MPEVGGVSVELVERRPDGEEFIAATLTAGLITAQQARRNAEMSEQDQAEYAVRLYREVLAALQDC